MATTNFENANLKLLIQDTAGIVTTASLTQKDAAPSGGGTPGGSDTQVQFNNGGAFGGSENFTWDNASGALIVNTCQGGAQTGVSLSSTNAVADEDSTVLALNCGTGPGINSRNITVQTILGAIGSGLGETVGNLTMLLLNSPGVSAGSSITGSVFGLFVNRMQLSNPLGTVYGVYIDNQGNTLNRRFGLYVAGGISYIGGDLILDGIVDADDEYSIKPTDRQLANPGSGTVLDWSTPDVASFNAVLKLTPRADPPGTPTEGMIYADTDHHLYYYNGTTWKTLDN